MFSGEPRGRLRRLVTAIALWLFTGFGLLIAVVVALDWLQAVGTYTWRQASCTIDASAVVEHPESGSHAFTVAYQYRFHGTRYAGGAYRRGYSGSDSIVDARRLASVYAPGGRVPCWVNPDAPREVYLRRANLWRGLFIFLPLAFAAIGGGALWLLHRLRRVADAQADDEPATVRENPFKLTTILVIFFGIFFLFGAGFFVPFFLLPALRVVEARSWQPVPCEIVTSGVRTHAGEDGSTYSVEALYRYRLGGREYVADRYQFLGGASSGRAAKAAAVERISAGAVTTCYVDPEDPFDAVIERGFTRDYLFGLLPLVFVLVGAGGLGFVIYGARSLKREAARPSWPASSSSAAAGPVELEPATGRGGKLGCAVVVALLWNGIVSLFIAPWLEAWRAGSIDWFLTIVLLPFALIGLLLLAGIPYSALALANPRPRLSLSRGALRAGEAVEIRWSFRGAARRVRRLRIWLQASVTTTESVVHDSGFSIRTNTDELEDARLDVVDRGPAESPASGSVRFDVPADAPPTSPGVEAVSWKLHLAGSIRYWPDVTEAYEIVVFPANERSPSESH